MFPVKVLRFSMRMPSWEAVIEPVLEMLPEKADTPAGVIAPPLEMPGHPKRSPHRDVQPDTARHIAAVGVGGFTAQPSGRAT